MGFVLLVANGVHAINFGLPDRVVVAVSLVPSAGFGECLEERRVEFNVYFRPIG